MFARKSKVSPHAAEDSDQTDHTDTTPVAAPEQSATVLATLQHEASSGHAPAEFPESIRLPLDNDIHSLLFLVAMDLFGRSRNDKSTL